MKNSIVPLFVVKHDNTLYGSVVEAFEEDQPKPHVCGDEDCDHEDQSQEESSKNLEDLNPENTGIKFVSMAIPLDATFSEVNHRAEALKHFSVSQASDQELETLSKMHKLPQELEAIAEAAGLSMRENSFIFNFSSLVTASVQDIKSGLQRLNKLEPSSGLIKDQTCQAVEDLIKQVAKLKRGEDRPLEELGQEPLRNIKINDMLELYIEETIEESFNKALLGAIKFDTNEDEETYLSIRRGSTLASLQADLETLKSAKLSGDFRYYCQNTCTAAKFSLEHGGDYVLTTELELVKCS